MGKKTCSKPPTNLGFATWNNVSTSMPNRTEQYQLCKLRVHIGVNAACNIRHLRRLCDEPFMNRWPTMVETQHFVVFFVLTVAEKRHLSNKEHWSKNHQLSSGSAKSCGLLFLLFLLQYPLVICYIAKENHHFFKGKTTASMAIFNSYVTVITRGYISLSTIYP